MPAHVDSLIILSPADNVGVARSHIGAGQSVLAGGTHLVAQSAVPRGHKMALAPLASGDHIIKYGWPIGVLTEPVPPGGWIHTHNLAFQHTSPSARVPAASPAISLPGGAHLTFMGYQRPGGSVGTRNCIAVIPTVNCAQDTVQIAVARLRAMLPDYPGVDAVVSPVVTSGCALDPGKRDHQVLSRCLAGIANHPNTFDAILVGLGCECNQPADVLKWEPGRRHPALSIQEAGGVRKTVDAVVAHGEAMLRRANELRRTPCPIAGLVVGTNCGGSDAFSGITANPALGLAGDSLISAGAGWVLAETPETYGAEHILAARAARPDIARRLGDLMQWWDQYTLDRGATVDSNPAPGNKEGGLTTIVEKALGAVTKGGSTPLRAIYSYGEPVLERGLTFMDTPGLDNASVTGIISGGCNVVAFTTGRGSCMGSDLVPVVKIGTNPDLHACMPDEIDVDAGPILDGVSIEEISRLIRTAILDAASGRRTCAEQLGLGTGSFNPWLTGATL